MATTTAAGSLWLAAEPAPPDGAPTPLPAAVDVAVIGGGIAGLTTALLAARDGASVAVIEAGRGGAVVEGVRAVSVREGAPCRVRTTAGELTADRVVVATHYPFLDRGLFFARLEVQRSYCIAARVRGAPPEGMSISARSPTRSVR